MLSEAQREALCKQLVNWSHILRGVCARVCACVCVCVFVSLGHMARLPLHADSAYILQTLVTMTTL